MSESEEEGGLIVEERRLLIAEMLQSEVWVSIVRPCFQQALRDLRDRLEANNKMDLPEIREAQGRAFILRKLVDEPKSIIR